MNQTGPCTTTHIESGGFTRSRPGVTHPDIMFHFFPSQLVDHGRTTPSLEAFQIHAGPMRQASRGWIKLKSKNPKEHPLIQPNYLSEGKQSQKVSSKTDKKRDYSKVSIKRPVLSNNLV